MALPDVAQVDLALHAQGRAAGRGCHHCVRGLRHLRQHGVDARQVRDRQAFRAGCARHRRRWVPPRNRSPSRRRRWSAPRPRRCRVFAASRAACSGAPPPNAISVWSAATLPRSMACTLAAFAMFSSTISTTPAAGQNESSPSGSPTCARERRRAALGLQPDPAAGEALGIDLAERQIGIRDRGLLAAAAVAGRARHGACAVRADRDPAHRVDPRDRAAARADLDHLDRRNPHRQAAALEVALGARDLEQPRRDRAGPSRADRSWRWCRPCRTRARDRCPGSARSARRGSHRRPGPNSTSRIGNFAACSSVVRPPPDIIMKQRAAQAQPPQLVLQALQIARHQRMHVGVGAGGREALVLAHLGAHLGRDA